MSKHICFIQMGGTIDKEYPRKMGGYAFEIGIPAVKSILEDLNATFSYNIHTVCQKDSQDIDPSDLEALHNYIQSSEHTHFIITHGTDTMIQTGQFLAQSIHDKTIIITGAIRPAIFKNSDAPTQIGGAIISCQFVSSGVYIAMHGTLSLATESARDPKTGQFIKIV